MGLAAQETASARNRAKDENFIAAFGGGDLREGNADGRLADLTASDDESWRKKNEIFNERCARASSVGQ
jgi:hypothetical protein